jgi:PKHD-type hydroxylase
MVLKHYFWYFKNAISPKTCDDIVNIGLLKRKKLATVGDYKKNHKYSIKEKKKLLQIRDSNIVWLSEPWIYAHLNYFIHTANRNAGWNFDWDWNESSQFTIYKKNQFYNWHRDSSEEPYPPHCNKNIAGKIRKLSLTVQLSDPKDYKGGEFMFDFCNSKDRKAEIFYPKDILSRGTVIVFPSFIWHKVAPVTKGTRYSLVNWSLGKPFK